MILWLCEQLQHRQEEVWFWESDIWRLLQAAKEKDYLCLQAYGTVPWVIWHQTKVGTRRRNKGLLPNWNSQDTGHAFSHLNPIANITSQVQCSKTVKKEMSLLDSFSPSQSVLLSGCFRGCFRAEDGLIISTRNFWETKASLWGSATAEGNSWGSNCQRAKTLSRKLASSSLVTWWPPLTSDWQWGSD